MSLHGKQIRDLSIRLDKLDGNGNLILASGAGITFSTGSKLNVMDLPSSDFEVANKKYVDSIAAGLDPKMSVSLISVSNITLSGNILIDGVTASTSSRVLVVGQTDKTENGIYVASGATWSRATDSDGTPNSEVSLGNYTFIENGTTYKSTGWVLYNTDSTNDYITPGVNTQEWTKFSEVGQQAGDGLYQVGNIFNVNVSDGTTTGLTTSAGVLMLNDTSVVSGLYGSSSQTLNINVDSKGRLLSVSTSSINITSNQISDLAQGILDNYQGSLTAGKGLTGGGNTTYNTLDLDLQIDGGLTFSDTSVNAKLILDYNKITSSLQGNGLIDDSGLLSVNVGNGISINNDQVQLGGTLSVPTTILTNGNTFSVDGNFIVSSTFSLPSYNQKSILFVSTQSGNLTASSTLTYDYNDGLAVGVSGSNFNVNNGGFSFDDGSGNSLVSNNVGVSYASNSDMNLYLISGTDSNANIYYGRNNLQNLNFLTYNNSTIKMNLDKDGKLNIGLTGLSGDSTLNIGATSGTQISLYTNNNINKVGILATGSTSWNLTLPQNAGTVDYVLKTDGNGVTTWVDVNTLASGDISSVGVGQGLTGGGTSGGVTISIADTISGSGLTFSSGILNIGDGKGLNINVDSIELDVLDNSGLTFSTSGTGGKLKVLYNSSLYINNNGELSISTASNVGIVVYNQRNLVPAVTSGDNQSTTLTISSTPNDAILVSVYVNGQLQLLGDGVKTTDCYFSSDSGSTAKSILNIVSGDTLYWNGLIAGFDLDANDRISINYNV